MKESKKESSKESSKRRQEKRRSELTVVDKRKDRLLVDHRKVLQQGCCLLFTDQSLLIRQIGLATAGTRPRTLIIQTQACKVLSKIKKKNRRTEEQKTRRERRERRERKKKMEKGKKRMKMKKERKEEREWLRTIQASQQAMKKEE